ncbi:CDP-alcohol phosphatidyltransferase [Vibrio cholerae]|uniref:CDP-alcohol phosphatidyltransferase family protein n=1 Tax=Vibrio cholerae TaxID=666 RepID=UPI000BA9516C|nr:CDP-alcohol phosphatidyltransferase family protein [Vibrio cholerae]EJK2992307.1 CDP-alcohol phosphatidyltransferase family protein [Vibrio cholerae]EJL6902823.1 CDP-alcohol phosphatidyltransferase family protein [Vibrio cholerae]ELL0577701.1 CDP-alcohol phosphatidyltransferase family protein [Vibrio cholerae]ELT7224885.1 CDP-alcohol phosphatidyltransferase family protein [Vibrio cholerae]PAS42574.1 CDP-alcohol phosphatidyltransferase [Vibrio cholerae]
MSLSVYQLKPRFQSLLRPMVIRLYQGGVSANQVTVFAALGSILLGALLLNWPHPWLFALIPVWMLIRMALNAIDGMLAREFGQQSRLGTYLNELADILSDAILYLPFALLGGVEPVLVIALTLLAIASEYAGVLGLTVGAERSYDGPMGKSDRAFVFGLLGLAVSLGWLTPFWLNLILSLVILLLCLTIFNRVKSGLKQGENAS